jgi:putative transposase
MRYPSSEKAEIIRLVEQSPLPVRRTLAQLGVAKSTFYLWYERYLAGGTTALEDRRPSQRRSWNKIPAQIEQAVLDLALAQPELSPRELAVNFTDRESYFVSEASGYRLLKTHDLITSPAFVLLKAADQFAHPTTAPNQLWQTDFTYLKVIGWGWFYLSTVLDDFSRYILAWKLCTTMGAGDVADTLQMALKASGLSRANVRHRPRLLSDKRALLRLGRTRPLAGRPRHGPQPGQTLPPNHARQDRTLAPLDEEPDPAGKLLSARRARAAHRRLRRLLQHPALP